MQFILKSNRALTLIFAATMAVYLTMIFGTLANLSRLNNAQPVFDMMPLGYSAAQANHILQNLGAAGREYYLWRQLPLDFIYPMLFALTFYGIARKSADSIVLASLPIIAAIADYAENLSIILLINTFPEPIQNIVFWASIFSITKSMATTAFFFGLIVVFTARVWSKIKSRRVA